jgi:hypothetical protein
VGGSLLSATADPADVETGRECLLAGSTNDNDSGLAFVLERVQRIPHHHQDFRVHRVALVRTVDGQRGDVARLLHQQEIFSQVSLLSHGAQE